MLSLVTLLSFAAAPDVILVSVDTLRRADHLGCYGYARDTSPHIDALAQSALLFEDCVCEVPITSPSFCAMFSSLYPRMTGTIRNGLPLPESASTITEHFHRAGYQTFCVQSNWTLKRKLSGLDRGFDIYEDDFHKKRWGVLKSERFAGEVTELALKYLKERNPDRPLFCWIHYSDPHAPYLYHNEFDPTGTPLRKLEDTAKTRAKYDSEIAFTDHHLGRLLKALPKDNAFLLFVADHGESLYEHDYLGHGRRIYQTGLHIPLIIRGPGVKPGRTSTPARGIDIGPTLLAMAGLKPAQGMLGKDLLGGGVQAGRARVVETYGGAVPGLPGARALMAGRPPMRQGVLQGEWKLILHDRQPELFNLKRDPMEEDDLAKEHAERVDSLRALVTQWDTEIPRVQVDDTELNQDDLEALEDLGYLE